MEEDDITETLFSIENYLTPLSYLFSMAEKDRKPRVQMSMSVIT